MFIEFTDYFDDSPILMNVDAIESITVVDGRMVVNPIGQENSFFIIKGDWGKIKEALNGRPNVNI